jgi:hypothetical protein
MTAIHQFLPTFAGRDAIGMHVLRLQRLLRDAGFDSDIYATHLHDVLPSVGAPHWAPKYFSTSAW